MSQIISTDLIISDGTNNNYTIPNSTPASTNEVLVCTATGHPATLGWIVPPVSTSATNASNVAVTTNSADTADFITFVHADSGNNPILTNTSLLYNATTNTITATLNGIYSGSLPIGFTTYDYGPITYSSGNFIGTYNYNMGIPSSTWASGVFTPTITGFYQCSINIASGGIPSVTGATLNLIINNSATTYVADVDFCNQQFNFNSYYFSFLVPLTAGQGTSWNTSHPTDLTAVYEVTQTFMLVSI